MPLIHIYYVQILQTVDSFLAIHNHTTYRSGRVGEERGTWDLSQFKCGFGTWEQGGKYPNKQKTGLAEAWYSIIKQK